MRSNESRTLRFLHTAMILCSITLSLSVSDSSLAAESFHIDHPADWVDVPESPNVLPNAESLAYKGVYYHLYDRQINVIDPYNQAQYRAYEVLLTNQKGVSHQSQIEINIDASYEHLVFHELGVIRKGQFLDKLGSTRIEALRSENRMSSLIYNGTTTITAILNDVRVGDILRYTYTVEGSNPVFGKEIEIPQNTQYGFNINRIAFTMHTSTERNFYTRTRHINKDFKLETSENNGIRTFNWSADQVSEIHHEDNEPAWTVLDPFFTISTIADWEDVVNWSLPHYNKPETQNQELATVAARIERRNDTVEAKVGAALQWVQGEIRYFGIELGENSHNPSSADTTLSRRYGDCKDKTVLLIALLNKLGVNAQPALVNTRGYLRDPDYPYRQHAFNHVIVHLEVDGVSHFVDPTLDTQKGDLGRFSEPDYGKALIVAEGENSLRTMNNASELYKSAISKTLIIDDIDDTKAELTVRTHRSLGSAEDFRWNIQNYGFSELSDMYQNYYREYYNRLETTKPLKYKEYPQNNSVLTEQYAIEDIWGKDADGQWSYVFYADEIRNYLTLPETPKYRTRPYQIMHPVNISETNVIQLPQTASNIVAEYATETISNDYFTLSVTIEQDPETRSITFLHTYKTHAAVIPADAMPEFEEDINRAWYISYFDIYKRGLVWEDEEETTTNKPNLLNTLSNIISDSI